MSRPALIAVVGGVLILAVFALTRTVGEAGESEAPPAAVEPPAQAGERPAAKGDGAAKKERRSRVPAGLERALARKQVVVLAFTQQGGADDAAVREAVSSLRGVPVFVADVRELGAYREIVGELHIDQAPAVVIVGKERKAQVLQGYVDPGSLAQQVEDAR